MQAPDRQRFNLLELKPIRALVLWSGFPYIFQALLLLLFIGLIVLSWNDFAPQSVNDKLYAKTHLVNLTVWGIWWPLMVWLAVLFGRIWCTVCPLELVNNLSERLGRRIGIQQRKLGKWLISGVFILIFYATIQMLIAGMHLHRVPAYTSIFLTFMIATAFITGLLFENRAYCRGFCAVGLLLKAYGRGGMVAVRPESSDVCHDCGEKWCIKHEYKHKLDARSCPTLLEPTTLDNNRDCLVCTQCIKACQPNNMQLQLRAPYSSQDGRESEASWPMLLFIMLLSGFVTLELCTESPVAKSIFLWPVDALTSQIGIAGIGGWLEGIWALIIFPLLLWSLLGGINMLMKGASSLTDAWRNMAFSIVIIIAAGHMSKGLAKFTSWGGFFPDALRDPSGRETVQAMTANPELLPAPLLSFPTVTTIALGLMGIAIFYAIREARLAHADTYKVQVPSIALLAGLFSTIIISWF